MPLMNRILGALRGATNPGHQGGQGRPVGGVNPGAGRPAGRSGGLAGLVTSVLGNRRRRY